MNNDNPLNDSDAAAIELIRQKLDRLYAKTEPKKVEPTPRTDLPETIKPEPSVHQVYRDKLINSGKLVAEIQTEWHNYYLGLSDDQKRQVWNEFYKNNTIDGQKIDHPEEFESVIRNQDRWRPLKKNRQSKKPLTKRKHLIRSIVFGLSIGIFCIIIILFGFFNEQFVAPFITPSRNLSVQSIIVDNSNVSVSPNPVIIIPKINVEIPVVYSVPTINDAAIEVGLNSGVVHYATTAYPGQDGNGVIFGHSAGNIFNPGLYKFAFSLLHYLQIGDTFTINYQTKSYTYQIFNKFVVPPTDVSVINLIPGHLAAFTLITCDPPGLSTNRLIIQADQINPNPNINTASSPISISSLPQTLPSESPSLWSRLTNFF
jgi:sortase A